MQIGDTFFDVSDSPFLLIPTRLANLDFSFQLCFSSNLSPVLRLALKFVAPIFMLTLIVAFSISASKIRCLSRFVSNHSCLRGIWLVILMSYFSLSNVVFSAMRCVRLQGKETPEDSYRFVDDPSIACYETPHLPLFVVSCFLALVLLPLPFIVPFLRRWRRLRPFADVCYANHRDSRWWWCSVDLLRRLLFTLISVFVPGQQLQTTKSSVLVVSSVLVLVVHSIGSPYRSKVENIFESFVLFDLCCVTVLALARGGVVTKTKWIFLFCLPWLTVVPIWVYLQRQSLRNLITKCCSRLLGRGSASDRRDQNDGNVKLNRENFEMATVNVRDDNSALEQLRDPLLALDDD